jgi:hypothetical protein
VGEKIKTTGFSDFGEKMRRDCESRRFAILFITAALFSMERAIPVDKLRSSVKVFNHRVQAAAAVLRYRNSNPKLTSIRKPAFVRLCDFADGIGVPARLSEANLRKLYSAFAAFH